MITPVQLTVILLSDLDLQADEEGVLSCLDCTYGDAEHTLVTVGDFISALEDFESDNEEECSFDVQGLITDLQQSEAACPGLLISLQG
jgi:hypothetical protein